MNTENKIHEYLEGISPKYILDLGCGRGRVLNLFAGKSSRIMAVDKRNFANLLPDSVTFIQKDIQNLETDKSFDLIIFSMILHFLEKGKAIKLIEKFKEKTSPEGYNFILCMSNHEKGKKENFYPSLDWLKRLYNGWNVKCEEFKTDLEEHDNLPAHKHNLIIFLAKRIL